MKALLPLATAGVLLLSKDAAAQLTMTGAGHAPQPIALSPFVSALEPFAAAIVTALVGAAATWMCATIARWAGAAHAKALDDGARAKFVAAAEREANVLIAAASDNLAHRSIDVGSPGVASAAKVIAGELPGAIKRLGLTPDGVARSVVAAIGAAQAGK